jgi:hypothetical protein
MRLPLGLLTLANAVRDVAAVLHWGAATRLGPVGGPSQRRSPGALVQATIAPGLAAAAAPSAGRVTLTRPRIGKEQP